MKFVRTVLIICAAALVLPSCKKEEEESTKSYLDGTLTVDNRMPSYVPIGKKYDFVPSGLSASDGTHVAYYFTDPKTSVKDTIMSQDYPATKYTYEIPDTLASLSIECTGYAEGSSDYYTTSVTQYFVIVNPVLNQGTLTGFSFNEDDEIANLYGDRYYCHQSGDLLWMRQNLAYVVGDESTGWTFGHPYYESDVMRTVFGSFYTWEEAQKACPEGWYLPSDKEWLDLLKESGVKEEMQPLHSTKSGAGKLIDWAWFNGEKMWEYYRDVNVTNETRISALPIGYVLIDGLGRYDYKGYGEYAAFWTSDEYEGKGVYRYIYMENDAVYVDRADKNGFAASVRCVKSMQ